MSAILGRRAWIRDGAGRLFTNLFVLLLGPSSLYRKSTCVGIAQDCAMQLEGSPDPRTEGSAPGSERILLPNQFTPESLLDILQQQPSGLLVIDEFRMFLDGLRRDYNSGLRELFMTLYDCRGVHRKIRSQEVRVESPCVSMLSACATRWFTEATKAGEIRSGFYPRLCMVPAWSKAHHLARGAAPDATDRRLLMRDMNRLRTVDGEINLPQSLENWFGDWTLQQQRTIEGLEHEAELASFYTRMERVALKLAVLSEVASDPTSRTISQASLMDGINLVTWLQAGLRRLFESEFTWSRDMEDKQKLLRIIERKPGIERRELLRLSHMKVSTFDPLIETLIQEGSATKVKGQYWLSSQAPQPVTQKVVTAQTPDSVGVSV
jgi:hypothetical protein